MPLSVIVNGKAYDGVDMELQFLGNDITGFYSFKYNTTIQSQNNHAKGRKPYSYSRGRIDYTGGSIGLYLEALNDIENALPAGTTILDLPPFPAVVRYNNGTGRIVKDIVYIMFNEMPRGAGTDEMGLKYEIPLHITNVNHNLSA
jgi:hypothetical protein